MRLTPHFLGLCLLLSTGDRVGAQGGVRVIFWDFEVASGGTLTAHYGLGYDHDLNRRLSVAGQVRYVPGVEVFSLDYRSAYHFADNDGGTFYMGPQVGYRRFSNETASVIPVGLRFGVRGGLQGFYADLHAGVFNSLGDLDGINAKTGSGRLVDVSPISFGFGLHMGLGWEGDD